MKKVMSIMAAIVFACQLSVGSVSAAPKAIVSPIIKINGTAFDGRREALRWDCPSAPPNAIVEIEIKRSTDWGYTVTNGAVRSGTMYWMPRIYHDQTESYYFVATWRVDGAVFATAESKAFKITLLGDPRTLTINKPPYEEYYTDSQAANIPISWTTTNMPTNAMVAISAQLVDSESGRYTFPTLYPAASGSARLDCMWFPTGRYTFTVTYVTEYGVWAQQDSLVIKVWPDYSIPRQ